MIKEKGKQSSIKMTNMWSFVDRFFIDNEWKKVVNNFIILSAVLFLLTYIHISQGYMCAADVECTLTTPLTSHTFPRIFSQLSCFSTLLLSLCCVWYEKIIYNFLCFHPLNDLKQHKIDYVWALNEVKWNHALEMCVVLNNSQLSSPILFFFVVWARALFHLTVSGFGIWLSWMKNVISCSFVIYDRYGYVEWIIRTVFCVWRFYATRLAIFFAFWISYKSSSSREGWVWWMKMCALLCLFKLA